MTAPETNEIAAQFPYFAYCAHDSVNELMFAECNALAGGVLSSDGFAHCNSVDSVARSAYIHWGAEHLGYGRTLDELVAGLAEKFLYFDRFRAEVFPLRGCPGVSTTNVLECVCDVIEGDVNLKKPLNRIAIVIRRDGYYCGRIVAIPDLSWHAHEQKPHKTSSSLPARIARALVNIICKPGDVLLNPCCGTGSILIEAASIGALAIGSDIKWNMTQMSRKNLAYFGYTPVVAKADAAVWECSGDCLITDLPYDRNCKTTGGNVRAILANILRMAPKVMVIASRDISEPIAEAGYACRNIYKIYKSSGFQRFVHYIAS